MAHNNDVKKKREKEREDGRMGRHAWNFSKHLLALTDGKRLNKYIIWRTATPSAAEYIDKCVDDG